MPPNGFVTIMLVPAAVTAHPERVIRSGGRIMLAQS